MEIVGNVEFLVPDSRPEERRPHHKELVIIYPIYKGVLIILQLTTSENMKLVLESSSMILLAKVSLIRGLLDEFDEVVISKEVYRESVLRSKELGYDDALITENLVKEGIIKIKGVKNEQMVKNFMEDFNINKGEAESLVLAQEENAVMIAVDDHQAIKICGILELPFTQAIHIVIRLAELGKITSDDAIEAIKRLEEYGWYADWIIEDAKREIEKIEYTD